MFVITMKFSENRAKASEFMESHNEWIRQGFDDGVFLLIGGLQPSAGGAIMAHNISRADLASRLDTDPFVAENIVSPEIFEISPAKVDTRLAFLKD